MTGVGRGHGRHAGQGHKTIPNGLADLTTALRILAHRLKVHFHGQLAVEIKSRVGIQGPGCAPRKQSRAHDQNHGQGRLHDHGKAPGRPTLLVRRSEGVTPRLLEIRDQVAAREPQGRLESEEDCSHDTEAQGPQQDTAVHKRAGDLDGKRMGAHPRPHGAESPGGQDVAQHTACQRQEQALHQQLRYNAEAPSTQGQPNGHLTPA